MTDFPPGGRSQRAEGRHSSRVRRACGGLQQLPARRLLDLSGARRRRAARSVDWPNNSPPKASSSIACRSPRSTGRRTRPRATPTARSTIAGTCLPAAHRTKSAAAPYSVGDGKSTHGDFDSIEEAITHLPTAGGEICLLPGLHETNAVIARSLQRHDPRLRYCARKSCRREVRANDPLFHVLDSQDDRVRAHGHGDARRHRDPSAAEQARRRSASRLRYNRILACEIAHPRRECARVYIHHNRIRMLDKQRRRRRDLLPADDSLIERNEITVIPAPHMPPIDVRAAAADRHPDRSVRATSRPCTSR